ncbi:MAG: PAS domain-containing sensor histidine kinase, partial [Candidatus Magasanikbacteria bacterium]|nr:PAS domain-containing sensor histidine kinase [Candidatus Magasanikbacteria bacterium]
KIVYANKMACIMAGCSPDEMIGQEMSVWGRLVEKKDYSASIPFEKAWKKIKKIKGYYEGELINQNKNGVTFITELHLSQVLNKKNKITFFVATARDVTKLREVDRAKTEFVSLASHELRTPLATISLAAELLLRYPNDRMDDQQRECLLEIFNSTKKMSTLITDLLNVSRIEMGTFNIIKEEIDLKKYLDTVLDNLKSQFIRKNLSVKRQFDHNLPTIYFDKNALNLIIDNLLSNAIQYTPVNGFVTVHAHYRKSHIVIEVSDTGFSVPLEEVDKLFFKHFRSKDAREITPEGEGLGLYIVKLAANRTGVKVWFEPNNKIQGATFYISIPAKFLRL